MTYAALLLAHPFLVTANFGVEGCGVTGIPCILTSLFRTTSTQHIAKIPILVEDLPLRLSKRLKFPRTVRTYQIMEEILSLNCNLLLTHHSRLFVQSSR